MVEELKLHFEASFEALQATRFFEEVKMDNVIVVDPHGYKAPDKEECKMKFTLGPFVVSKKFTCGDR